MGPELHDVVEPRPDVLAGTLTDAVFAASLDEVVTGTAPDAYGKPADFFAATYPSAGLRSLLGEVLGRIGGGRPDGAPVVRLETNLGGGKTHNLIALYHAARGDLDPLRAAEFMDPGLLPTEPVTQLSVFVGTATGATSFPEVHGITPSTLWGYLALQLGGAEAYEEVRSDDEHLTAPGAHALARVMAGRPTLVLLDEIARYLAVAEGRSVGRGTLAAQTTAFLMALMEAIASQPRAALVLTTTQVTDAFGEQTAAVLAAIADAQSLVARKEHVLRPSDEADLPRILARRLFARVDPRAAGEVAAAYAALANDAFSRGADLPERMAGPAFATDIVRNYPFHPDLITVLDKRLSTIPNFQRTRGALRLLARTVRLLWEAPSPGPDGRASGLIHLHHVDLADKDIAEDLSSRLDKGTFEPVIRADIASRPGAEPSHAEAVDARMGALAARRLATAAYLWSLTRDVPGVPASTLIGGVLAPGDDPNVLAKALDNLEASAWYLHCDARGYRFSVEPSLAKLVQESESQISGGRAKQAATDILAGLFRDSALKVRRSWEDAKVPDRDDDAWLVVLHWDEFGGDCGITDQHAVPPQVRELWEKTPAGGVREYRNRVVLLAPQARSHDAMLRTVRRHLALKDLARSGEMLRTLPDDKRREVADRARESELEARVAVCNHVNVLYVPQPGGLEPVELDVVTQASLRPNQTEAVLDRLAAMEKTLAAGDKPLDPGWIAAKLGAQLGGRLPTIELVRAFARRPDLKLVLDRAQVTALVSAGVRNGVWEYHDAERGDSGWATKDRPGASVRTGDDTALYPVGSAPPPAPVGGAGPLLPPVPVPRPAVGAQFANEGKADVAVVAARQAASDAGRTRVRQISLSIDELGVGTGTQLAKLLSVLPPSTPGAVVTYAIQAGVALAAPGHRFEATFVGLPVDYQPLRPGLDHVLGQHEATVKASVTAAFADPLDLGGQELDDIRRRAQDTGPAKCQVTITTEPG